MRLGVYDCIYVALAEQGKCELVTADTTMVRVLQPSFSCIRTLSSFP
jgi:predicted nucleic acid-binding protein